MSVVTALSDLIGTAPPGFEFLEYILAGMVLLFLVKSVFGIISAVLNWIGGK